MNKKVIVHFTKDLTGRSDGIFNTIRAIIDETNDGTFHHIILYEEESEVSVAIEKNGYIGKPVKGMRKKVPLKAILNYMNVIRSSNADVVHTHALKPLLISLITNVFLKKKLIFHFHGQLIKSEYYASSWQMVLRALLILLLKLNKITAIAPSDPNKIYLQSEMPYFSDVVVGSPGAESIHQDSSNDNDDEIYSRIQRMKDDGVVVLCFTGRILPQKRVDRCLEMYKSVRKSSSTILLVIGEGEYLNYYKEAYSEYQDVWFLGYRQDVRRIFQYIDAFILTSDYEGFPLVLWEVMAAGKPIVATKVSGIEEVLMSSQGGFVFNIDDIMEGINYLNILISQEDVRLKMGKEAYNYFVENNPRFNFIKMMKKLYLYDR